VLGLSFAVLLMTGAALGDRLGRRRVFAAGLAIFTVSSVACALAPGVDWLVVARAVQGTGAAMVLPLAVALLSTEYPPEERGRALGKFEGITGLATIAGPLVGGLVAQRLGWQWIFWINVPIGLIMIPLVLRRIPEQRGPGARIDIRGLLLATGSMLGLVWGLVHGNGAGWESPEILGSLVAGIVLAGAFVSWERRAPAPMLPMHFFRLRAFSAGCGASLLLVAALYGSVFLFGQLLQVGLGYSAIETGIRLVPWTATLLVVAPLAGVLADLVGGRPVVVAGLGLQAVGLGWVALVAEPGVGYLALLPALVLGGIGVSAAIPVVQSVIVSAVDEADIGKASGSSNTVQELGGVLGVAVTVATFTTIGSYESAELFVDGAGAALAVCAAFATVGALVARDIPGRRAPPG